MNKSIYIHETNVHNKLSASIVAPIIIDLLQPQSVVDVGCGLGDWLSVFQENGVKKILGIDGNWLNVQKLYVDKKHLLTHDLTLPLTLQNKFDLAICLEVAEHLSVTTADILVNSLVQLSNNIIFSAAVPGQGGQNHINEQWPKYWQEKFQNKGYTFYDAIRPLIWDNENIKPWYRQNIFLVSNKDFSNSFKQLDESPYSDIVLISIYKNHIGQCENEINKILEGKKGIRLGFQIFINSILNFIRRIALKNS